MHVKRCPELSVESLDEPIDYGVVSGRPSSCASKKSGTLAKQLQFKLTSSIASNVFRNPEAAYSAGNESDSHRVCCDVEQWYGLWPMGETIDASEDVGITTTWRQRSHKINVNVAKTQ